MDNFGIRIQDRNGRTINIGRDDDDHVVAEHEGIEIARFEFYMIDDEYNPTLFLAIMDIQPAYQRARIGKELMVYAEELYGSFPIISNLSMEGAALVNYCFDNKVFKHPHPKHHDSRF